MRYSGPTVYRREFVFRTDTYSSAKAATAGALIKASRLCLSMSSNVNGSNVAFVAAFT
jgi:hypothetical protein